MLGTGLARALGCCFPATLSTVSEMLGLEVVRLGESSHQTLLLPGLSGGLLFLPTRGCCEDRQGHVLVGCHGQEVWGGSCSYLASEPCKQVLLPSKSFSDIENQSRRFPETSHPRGSYVLLGIVPVSFGQYVRVPLQ